MAVFLCVATLSVGVGGSAVAASGAAKPSPTGAFAQHVLDEAILPPGARVTTVVRSRTLEGPPAEPGVSGLHDAHRFYLLDESMEAVESYLEAHVPRDATQLGYGKSGTMAKGILSVNLSYDLPVSGPHNYLAELSYLSVATGSAAELRVDAEVVWKPNRPADERAPRNGVVEVTAYPEASLMAGSSGPVTFTVTGARARSLIRALNALPLGPGASIGACIENFLLSKLVIRRAESSPPELEADGWYCMAAVEVSEHGRATPALTDRSCSLLRAVVRVLPAHEANATRAAGKQCVPPASPRRSGSKIPAVALARLTKVAREVARANGDVHASHVLAVATTHAAALRVATPGDSTPSVPAGMPVYLITMRGRFTAYDSSPPPGGSLPKGTFLAVVVDATTFRVTDWGLSTRPSPVRLSSLGRVHTLHRASAAPVRSAAKGAKLTSRLELSRTTEKAGASIGAVLVVTNPGTRINETHGCAPYLMVVLANKEIPADGVIPTPCRPGPYWIRHGVNRLRIVVSTRYAVCTQTPAQATVRLPVCLSGPVEAPPFPAGRYRTVAIGAWEGIPMPAPAAVTLIK
jgi:hypothetical protein